MLSVMVAKISTTETTWRDCLLYRGDVLSLQHQQFMLILAPVRIHLTSPPLMSLQRWYVKTAPARVTGTLRSSDAWRVYTLSSGLFVSVASAPVAECMSALSFNLLDHARSSPRKSMAFSRYLA